MAKHIALFAEVEIDGTTFNDGQIRTINLLLEDEQVPAGGFNSTGTTETLAGTRAKSIEIEFYTDRAAGEMAQVIYPLYRDRDTFELSYLADQNQGVSSTNPIWRGNCILPSWAEGATFGEVETTTLTFLSNGDDGLERYFT